MTEFDKTAAAFSEAVAGEVKRKLEEIEQKRLAQWQKVANLIGETASAKIALNLAREGKGATTVFDAAQNFRKMEAELTAAVSAMVDLVAQADGPVTL